MYVTARYPPFAGGTETHTFEVARRMVTLGHQIVVLTTNPRGDLPSDELSDGIRIRRVRSWPPREDFYLAPAIFAQVRDFDGDLVHCQGYHTFVAPTALLAARLAGIPYLVTFHSGGHSSRLRSMLRGPQVAALSPLLRGAEHLIAVSGFEAELFRKRIGLARGRIKVIPNGANLPAVPRIAVESSDALIVAVGRLERYKGHHRIIEAMPSLLSRVPNSRLRIVGTGPEKERLRRLAVTLGVTDRVDIGGIAAQDREAMSRLLASASLVMLLSEYEAHPVAVMEALAAGCPVLATHTSGLAELAEHGLIRTIPLRSTSEDVAQAMYASLLDPPPSEALELPSWDQAVSQLLQLYRDTRVRQF